MAAFDPYHQWLGIPATEQPPNHYRLLSVPLWEPDLDVIEAAAERQTVFLRTFQLGPSRARVGVPRTHWNPLPIARRLPIDRDRIRKLVF